MTHLQATISGVMTRRSITGIDASAALGLHPTSLSRLLTGTHAPKCETVAAIIYGLSNYQSDREELALAHLLDERERIRATALVNIVAASDATPAIANAEARAALQDCVTALDAVADLAQQAAQRAGMTADRTRAAAGVPDPLANEPIPYPKNEDTTLGHVAEDPPAKPVKKPPVSKK